MSWRLLQCALVLSAVLRVGRCEDLNIVFGDPDLSPIVSSGHHKYHLEAFKSTDNDRILQSEDPSVRLSKLQWFSLGEPKLVRIRDHKNTSNDVVFDLQPKRVSVLISTLMPSHRKALVAAVRDKYKVDVSENQFLDLPLSSAQCRIAMSDDSRQQFELTGETNHSKTFPLRVDFMAARSDPSRQLLEKRLMTNQIDEMNMNCNFSVEKKVVKIATFELSSEKLKNLGIVEKLFGTRNMVYVSRGQFLTLSAEMYSALPTLENDGMTQDQFSQAFISDVLKHTSNDSFTYVDIDEAMSAISPYALDNDATLSSDIRWKREESGMTPKRLRVAQLWRKDFPLTLQFGPIYYEETEMPFFREVRMDMASPERMPTLMANTTIAPQQEEKHVDLDEESALDRLIAQLQQLRGEQRTQQQAIFSLLKITERVTQLTQDQLEQLREEQQRTASKSDTTLNHLVDQMQEQQQQLQEHQQQLQAVQQLESNFEHLRKEVDDEHQLNARERFDVDALLLRLTNFGALLKNITEDVRRMKEDASSKHINSIATIAPGIVLGVVLIIGLALLFVWLRNRPRQPAQTSCQPSELDIKTALPMPATSPSPIRNHPRLRRKSSHETKAWQLKELPRHLSSIPRRIRLDQFKQHVDSLRANASMNFSKQFQELQEESEIVHRSLTWNAAERESAKRKNRYRNIKAYDHSRVWLSPTSDNQHCDYINANFIGGFHSSKEYIACQGPLSTTVNDHWQMIFEQDVSLIVMLTRCSEGEGETAREKCSCYWPELNETAMYGDVIVKTSKCTDGSLGTDRPRPHYVIREFEVTVRECTRTVTQYHCLIWDDFESMKKTALIEFVSIVRSSSSLTHTPIVVHCSAGVGRTGTFIALDILLHQIASAAGKDTKLDIFNTIMELRKCRYFMVNTESQYIVLHECVLDVVCDMMNGKIRFDANKNAVEYENEA